MAYRNRRGSRSLFWRRRPARWRWKWKRHPHYKAPPLRSCLPSRCWPRHGLHVFEMARGQAPRRRRLAARSKPVHPPCSQAQVGAGVSHHEVHTPGSGPGTKAMPVDRKYMHFQPLEFSNRAFRTPSTFSSSQWYVILPFCGINVFQRIRQIRDLTLTQNPEPIISVGPRVQGRPASALAPPGLPRT